MASTARDTVRDARDAMRESGEAAAASAEDIQADLMALREDVTDLAKKLGVILSGRGNSAWQHAKTGMGDTISDMEKKARETGDEMTDALNDALRTKPFTMLALAAGLGFIFGATWRR